jgi:hypothetical protein
MVTRATRIAVPIARENRCFSDHLPSPKIPPLLLPTNAVPFDEFAEMTKSARNLSLGQADLLPERLAEHLFRHFASGMSNELKRAARQRLKFSSGA